MSASSGPAPFAALEPPPAIIRAAAVALALLTLTACDDPSARGDGDDDLGAGRLGDGPPPDTRPDITGQSCRLNSDCLPGLYCGGGVCTFDCRVDRDCRRGTTCQSGECLGDDPAPQPDDGIPILDAERPDRGRDAMVTPPRDAMVPPRDAMPPPRDAMPVPDAAPPSGLLGSDCARAADCDSDVCVDLAVAGVRHTICVTPCCAEVDCPLGFGCQYLNGVKLCVPSRIYPPGYTFDRAAGQRCNGNGCQSGLCDVGADRCLASCCTDADCGGIACVWTPTGAGPRAICDPLPFGFGRTGDGCFGDLDCRSRICVPAAGAPGGAPGVCADPCCVHEDCFGGTGCGRVAAFDGGRISGVIQACVPIARGALADGSPCGQETDCAGAECIEGICTRPCCHDLDCGAGRRCLPRPTPEGIYARVCAVPDE